MVTTNGTTNSAAEAETATIQEIDSKPTILNDINKATMDRTTDKSVSIWAKLLLWFTCAWIDKDLGLNLIEANIF